MEDSTLTCIEADRELPHRSRGQVALAGRELTLDPTKAPPARLTYFLTVPFAAVAVVALLRFREPQLRKEHQPASLRTHIDTTYRALIGTMRLAPNMVLALPTTVLLPTIFEFGPLWLVAAFSQSVET